MFDVYDRGMLSRHDLLKIGALFVGLTLTLLSGFLALIFLHPFHTSSNFKHVVLPDTAATALVTVDISGAVRHPGLYYASSSKRIADVITQAGGFLPQADFSYIAEKLDLAKKLRDEEKIYVPYLGQRWSQSDQESGNDLVSINAATSDQLAELPGISKKRALQIVSLRPFSSLSDFQQRAGISSHIFQTIQKLITL